MVVSPNPKTKYTTAPAVAAGIGIHMELKITVAEITESLTLTFVLLKFCLIVVIYYSIKKIGASSQPVLNKTPKSPCMRFRRWLSLALALYMWRLNWVNVCHWRNVHVCCAELDLCKRNNVGKVSNIMNSHESRRVIVFEAKIDVVAVVIVATAAAADFVCRNNIIMTIITICLLRYACTGTLKPTSIGQESKSSSSSNSILVLRISLLTFKQELIK